MSAGIRPARDNAWCSFRSVPERSPLHDRLKHEPWHIAAEYEAKSGIGHEPEGVPFLRRVGDLPYFTPTPPGRLSISRRTLSFIWRVVSRYTSAGPGDTCGGAG